MGPPSPAVELLRLSAPHRDPISGNSSELVTIVRSFKLGQSWAQDAPKVGLRAATVCLMERELLELLGKRVPGNGSGSDLFWTSSTIFRPS